MSETLTDEFADIHAAVGSSVNWKASYFSSSPFLFNSEGQKVMELSGRVLATKELICWKGFSGEIQHGYNSFTLKEMNGGVLASVTNVLHPPLAVFIGNQTLTCERVWTKWWNPDLVLKDDDGEIIKCAYRSRQFQLLRAVDALPAAVAMFWLIFRLEQS